MHEGDAEGDDENNETEISRKDSTSSTDNSLFAEANIYMPTLVYNVMVIVLFTSEKTSELPWRHQA